MSTVAARTLLCPDRLENGAEPRLRYGSNVPPQAPASHGRPASSARPLARARTRGGLRRQAILANPLVEAADALAVDRRMCCHPVVEATDALAVHRSRADRVAMAPAWVAARLG